MCSIPIAILGAGPGCACSDGDNGSIAALLAAPLNSVKDTCAVACLYQLLIAKHGAKVWLEYVESDANVSDGPSRLLGSWVFSDLARKLGCSMEEAKLPDIDALLEAPLDGMKEVFNEIRVLFAK